MMGDDAGTQTSERLPDPRPASMDVSVTRPTGLIVVERSLARVFLSYSRTDLERAAALAHELEALGHDVWRDTDDIRGGEAWRRSIVRGIRSADLLVLLLSKASTASAHVRRELDIADEERRPVVPVLIEPTTVPDDMKYNLAGIQQLDIALLDATAAAAAIHRAIADVSLDEGLPTPGSTSPLPHPPPPPSEPVRETAAPKSPSGSATAAPLPLAGVGPESPAAPTESLTGPAATGSDASVAATRRSRRPSLVVMAVVVVVGGVAALAVARSTGDGWHPSSSPLDVPCRGLGRSARTAIRGEGATPGATVRSFWRNLSTGEQGDMDPVDADGRGRFKIGFECLPTEVGQRWSVEAADRTHGFDWTVVGVSS